MLSSADCGYSFPFPPLPNAGHPGCSSSGLLLRSFGYYRQDLEIHFRETPRPYLVTQILRCCTLNGGDRPDESFYWDLTVGKRIESLYAVATDGGRSALTIKLRCTADECGEVMEFEINQKEVARLQQGADVSEPISFHIGQRDYRFRLPTGGDQRDWLDRTYSDNKAAVLDMARTLMLPDQSVGPGSSVEIADHAFDALNEAISEKDPLTAMTAGVVCPACGLKNRFMFDFEGRILKKLAAAQQQLFHDIHILAGVYHWSEREILSVPSWRRRKYLRLIDKGLKR